MAKQPTIIPNDQLATIFDVVQALPVIEPQGMTKAEAIQSMRPALEDALSNRGYTYDMLADVLTRQGIKISGATLREYLRQKPTVTYQALLGMLERLQTFDVGVPSMAALKALLPKLSGLTAKQIAESLKGAGYAITTANVSALIRQHGGRRKGV